nr:YARHG domain-containing protein [Pseudanabaena sp. FACHB-1998]
MQNVAICMIGKVISGRYQIIKNLGGGGFGQTFLAEDLQLPDHHQCVVKRLQPESNDAFIWETASRLFDAEARILHKLGSHDRIPRLLAHFEENRQFYLVQELIDGYDLTQELIPNAQSADGYPIGRMNEAQAIAFLQDVLEILAFVHQQGAIHRDLKPANLMRRRTDGKLVLIDFGAVKQVSNTTAIASTVAIGTDGYMPNEQAIGKPRPCSDLYAVGAIAIQGLTGVVPSQLLENMETGELAWRNSPPYASIKYRANVSDELAQIIEKLVRYDFRDRYQSAEAALADVQRLYVLIAPTIVSSNITQAQEAIPQTFVSNFPAITTAYDDHIATRPNRNIWFAAIAVLVMAGLGAFLYLRPSAVINNDVNVSKPSNNASNNVSTPKYLFLSQRLVNDSDLANKGSLELDIMRNEIFARYGRRFQDPELQSYFNSQPWYQPRYAPNQFPTDLLTPIELQNITSLRDFHAKTATKSSASSASPNLQNSQCDYSQRIISDPQPPLNVRSGAGQDFAIVGTLDNGTQVKVEGEKKGWLQISTPITGWVAANRTKSLCL